MRACAWIVASLGVLMLASTAAAADAELGKKLFVQKCAGCHGADGKGNGKMAERLKVTIPDLTNSPARTDSELTTIISDGKKPMPAFGKSLSPNELNAVLHYTKGLNGGPTAGKK